MLYAGASDGSVAQTELASFLFGGQSRSAADTLRSILPEFESTSASLVNKGSKSSDGPELYSANSIWGSQSVLEAYKSEMRRYFGAAIEASRDHAVINKWIADKTMGFIKDLLTEFVHFASWRGGGSGGNRRPSNSICIEYFIADFTSNFLLLPVMSRRVVQLLSTPSTSAGSGRRPSKRSTRPLSTAPRKRHKSP
jgi:hypothetical protein